ncbi:alpha/beta hydrolase [Oscillatoria sp. FACHB-1406]|uniref:alpha/beta fold hydrolase n=1 Tax=Oscillatoria sp. FACHB-1406 TaxID=2692846 RepID=UPI001682BB00|nr:alpha/beta hydrolase [Oscillatoria sp. FACHB-1406]MBD2577213.1 alpha/beta hydrolase [Oscillatoria sp. FACHB-1406]
MTYLSFLKPRKSNPNAPLFVYLPGMDSTGQLLHAQIGSLESCFDVRCAAIPAENLQDWDALQRQVTNAIEAERGQRQVVLCGESFGGCLAMKVAIAQPEAIDTLILSNPASSFSRYPLYHWAIPLVESFPEPLYRGTAGILLPFLAETRRVEPKNSSALLAAMQSLPPKTVSWRLSLLRDFQIDRKQLQRFNKPVVLIAGAADRLLPSVQEAKRLAGLFPDARICILPDSGHACLLEKEIKLDRILKRYGTLPQNLSSEESSFSSTPAA